MKIKYSLSGGLMDSQCAEIHKTALRILEKIGMEIHTDEVPVNDLFRIISDFPGVNVKGNRVYFSPEIVEKYLEEYKVKMQSNAGNEEKIAIYPPRHSCLILDVEGDNPRPIGTADVAAMSRLTESYREQGVIGGPPGPPQDVRGELRSILHYKIGCEYNRTEPHVSVSSVAASDYIYEMAKIMGYATPQSYHCGVHPISPLKLEGEEFDVALHFWKRLGSKLKVDVGPMPIMGVTSPVFFPASLAQSIAEGLGGFVFFNMLTGGDDVGFWFNFYAFDMKYGNFSYGGPEDSLIALVRNRMSLWYGLPNNCGDKALHTMAHAPDAQAAAEKSSKTVIALLSGARQIHGAGMLSLDEAFSPEQFVIDMEIVNWAKKVMDGFEFTEESLGFDVIKEAVEEKTDFLMHQTTIENYRKTYWTPDIFHHLMKNQWEQQGSKSLRRRIKEIINKRLASEGYILDKERRDALNEVYKRAEASL